MPVQYDELPAVLTHQNRHGDQTSLPAADGDPPVPTALPTVPPERTLTGRLACRVLSRQEYTLYVQTWRHWLHDHPEYDTADGREKLAELCMAEVRMHRLIQCGRRGLTGRVGRLYHTAFLHMNRIRHQLGATRRQRLLMLQSGSY
jgi:hypothetical protein